jgi:AcrR family transcriptional regulator
MAKLSFREHVLRVREDAILAAVKRLLADKGFDLMTVDEVAAEVGIAKASLYKHFASKEALAAAAMVQVLQRALELIGEQNARPGVRAIQRIEALVRWAVTLQLAGEMPSLPSQNSTLRAELLANKGYIDRLIQVSDGLGAWIEAARAEGDIDDALPGEVVLYTLFARACDPVPGFLKAGGQHENDRIVDWVVAICLNGLRAAPRAA